MRELAGAGSGVITAAQVRDLGADKNDIRALLRHPDWARRERGVYVYLAGPTRLDVDHHRECAAALATLRAGTDAAVSHLSAVRLLGLPTPPRHDQYPVITRRLPAPANRLRHARVHVASYDENELMDVAGVPVLAGRRLIVDCSATMPGESVLAVADAMLARGLITRATLGEYLRRHPGVRGSRLSRIILDRADPKAENWFESASRWWVLEAGLPKPLLQVPFTDHLGRVKARVDMLFADHQTVGEADGRGKYDAPGALFAEKHREDWLRSQKRMEVVRWTPSDLRTRASRIAWINRLLDAFKRAGHPQR